MGSGWSLGACLRLWLEFRLEPIGFVIVCLADGSLAHKAWLVFFYRQCALPMGMTLWSYTPHSVEHPHVFFCYVETGLHPFGIWSPFRSFGRDLGWSRLDLGLLSWSVVPMFTRFDWLLSSPAAHCFSEGVFPVLYPFFGWTLDDFFCHLMASLRQSEVWLPI